MLDAERVEEVSWMHDQLRGSSEKMFLEEREGKRGSGAVRKMKEEGGADGDVTL